MIFIFISTNFVLVRELFDGKSGSSSVGLFQKYLMRIFFPPLNIRIGVLSHGGVMYSIGLRQWSVFFPEERISSPHRVSISCEPSRRIKRMPVSYVLTTTPSPSQFQFQNIPA